MRECYNCGSNHSSNNNWYLNHDESNNVLCQKCNCKLITNKNRNAETVRKWNKIIHLIHNPRRIKFRGKTILLKENPRSGICSWCGKKGYTQLHHIQYHESDPLKDTTELCASCHMKESIRLGQIIRN